MCEWAGQSGEWWGVGLRTSGGWREEGWCGEEEERGTWEQRAEAGEWGPRGTEGQILKEIYLYLILLHSVLYFIFHEAPK